VPQCGYCQSGMVMAAAALLAHDRDPTDETISQAITNLCRCGTYPRIRRAVRRAARVMRGEETIAAAPPPHADVGDAAAAVPALAPPPGRQRPR
jgi:isoquinoline 1-oxidoreductase alpha subunit